MARRIPRPGPAGATAVGLALTIAAAASMITVRGHISRAAPALALVLPIVVAGLLGGRRPALVTALAGAAALNLAFIEPYWTLKVEAFDDLLALLVFGVVAVTVGTLVAREGERRKAAEDRSLELEVLNAELLSLERERQRLSEEATRAAVLERVDEQRSALLRSVSHDLRTPLSTIRAVATDLSEADYDSATRAELLALVAGEAERLDRLVANLLSLSRVEAGALRPDRQAVSMDELIEHCVSRLSRVLDGRRVQIELPTLHLVDGDFTQLDQVVANLLENAARHAPSGSTIRIGGRSRDESVELWVDDEGIGIPPFSRQQVFEPFRSGEGSSSSGIGLAICKAIVEAHGGTIEALDAPGGGARLCLTLPVRHG